MLLWLPYAVVTGKWPDEKFAAVAAALALAYVIGHVLQSIAASALPVRFERDPHGRPSLPSETMLDAADKRLAPELKQRIRANVKAWFRIDVAATGEPHEDVAARRKMAFELCRPIVNARTLYAEQLQGLYVMMRGLAIAFGLCAFYMAGWAGAPWLADRAPAAAMLVIGGCFILAIVRATRPFGTVERRPVDRTLLSLIAIALLAAGSIVATRPGFMVPVPAGQIFLACTLIYCVVALRCLVLYWYFGAEFARAVWTSFAVEPTDRPV